MSPTQHGNVLLTKLDRCDEVHDESVFKGIFIKKPNESIRGSMRKNFSTNSGATLGDFTRHATSPRAVQKKDSFHFQKQNSRHLRNLNNRCGKRGNSPITISVVKTGGTIAETTPTLTTDAPAVKKSNVVHNRNGW